MDEKVVSLSAWKAQKPASQAPTKPIVPGDRDLFREVFRNMIGKVEDDGMAARMVLCMDLEEKLAKFQFPINTAKINAYRPQIEDYEDKAVFTLIENATDIQLRTKPYFFYALLAVARSRVIKEDTSEE